mgnify:CR=1 FL=1
MNRAPVFNLPPVVVWLAAALAAVHGVRQLIGPAADTWVLLAFAFIPARYGEIGAALPGGLAARLWSPVTYAFLHADAVHLIVNLVWMASFGGALARRFGAMRFLLLSVLSAAAGAALYCLVRAGEEALMIGASGAVSGMMAATARFAFSPGGPLAGGGRSPEAYRLPADGLGTVIRSSRALGFILMWFAVNLIFGLAGGLVPGAAGPIAWEAHIGGFLAGLLAFPLFDPVPRERTPGDELAS